MRPKCELPGCGREMKPLRLLGIPVYTCCPANRDEHRIAALESALSESEAARRELERRLNDALLREENDPTIGQRDEAESAMSEAYELVMDEYPEWSSAFGFREALDAMNERLGADARNLRALAKQRGDEVLSLNTALKVAQEHIAESIQYAANEDGSPYPASSYDYASEEVCGGIQHAITNTSATAAQVRAEIEREALEAAWERVRAHIESGPAPSTASDAKQIVRAAILGEKGGDDGSV